MTNLTQTFFKTPNLSLNPESITAIEVSGNQLKVYTHHGERPFVAPMEKGEDGKPLELEDMTQRWAEAIECRSQWNKLFYSDNYSGSAIVEVAEPEQTLDSLLED